MLHPNYLLSILLLFTWFLYPLNTYAQEESYEEGDYLVERFTAKDGLPEDEIRAIRQSRKGFLWLTTPHFVVKYDGYTFESWAPKWERDFGFFPDWIGNALSEDTRGHLWIPDWREQGLYHFNALTHQFTHFHIDNTDGLSISHDWVTGMIEDKYGVIWVGTENGLN